MKKLFIAVTVLFAAAGLFAFDDSFTYQGRVFSPPASNSPVVDSATNVVTIKIFDSLTLGTELWNKTVNNVVTKNGYFSVEVSGFGSALDFKNNYWMEIVFNGETLAPRQKMTVSPYAGRAMKANAVESDRNTYGKITLTASSAADITFGVTNTAGTAVAGYSLGGIEKAGVAGASYSASSQTAGVYGFGYNGIGVYGEAAGTNVPGVQGEADNGFGVVGRGVTGVAGITENMNGVGVYASGNMGGTALQADGRSVMQGADPGMNNGILTVKNSAGTGTALWADNYGRAIVATSQGGGIAKGAVEVYNTGTFGTLSGVYSVATSTAQGTGVFGTGSYYGVSGTSSFGIGVGGSGATGVIGEGTMTGVQGTSNAPSGKGVWASNDAATGAISSGSALYVMGKISAYGNGTVSSPVGRMSFTPSDGINPSKLVVNNLCNNIFYVFITPQTTGDPVTANSKPISWWVEEISGGFYLHLETDGQVLDNNAEFNYFIINQ